MKFKPGDYVIVVRVPPAFEEYLFKRGFIIEYEYKEYYTDITEDICFENSELELYNPIIPDYLKLK